MPLPTQDLTEALKGCSKSLVAVGVFSFVANALMLTPLFYMMNVFDKAVSTNSSTTLASLAIIALFLYALLAAFEWLRSLVLVHIANRLDYALAPRLYDLCFQAQAGLVTAENVGSQPLSDLNSFRQFLGSPSVTIIFDLPWTPFLLAVMYFFHPALATVAVICLLIMTAIAFANQRLTSKAVLEANQKSRAMTSATEKNLRNAEVAAAMGMMGSLRKRWREKQEEVLAIQTAGSSTASGFQAGIKTLNMVMQSVAITTGAVLVMAQEIAPGTMIVAALLLGKFLQPIQQAVSTWKGLVEAHAQYDRLNDFLAHFPPDPARMPLPGLKGRIVCRNVTVIPPRGKKPTLAEVSLDFVPGTTTVILGASGAGKSTLLRALLGLWPYVQGEIRYDGAEVRSYDRESFGSQVGYLPQDIELFEGSVAENIARFGELDPDSVYRAAEDAGVKELILALPEGFNTKIVGSQGLLSPGQRQRIALARALYDRPKIFILDEPNSNLDSAGDQALSDAIQMMRNQGSTVIIVSHRPNILPLADNVVVMGTGRVQASGPRDQVVSKLQTVGTNPGLSSEAVAAPPASASKG